MDRIGDLVNPVLSPCCANHPVVDPRRQDVGPLVDSLVADPDELGDVHHTTHSVYQSLLIHIAHSTRLELPVNRT